MSFGPPPSVFTQSSVAADRRRRKRRAVLLGAAATALAVLLGAGVRLLWPGPETGSGGKGGPTTVRQAPDDIRETVEKRPSSPEGRPVFEQDEEDVPGATDAGPRYAPGTWATGRVFAKGVAGRIDGYRTGRDDTEKAWTLDLGGHLCATSRHVTADGRTAVVVQPRRAEGGAAGRGVCDQVVFVDLHTGRKLWRRTMPSAGSAYATNTNLTLTKSVVAVAWGRGSVAYDMKDGRELWNGTTVSTCEDKGFAGGRVLLALVKCGEPPQVTFKVQKLAPRTGRPQWTYKVADGVQDVYLPSSEPPVLAVEAGDSVVTDLISLDGRGGHLATVSLDGYEAKCGARYFSSPLFGVVENCDGMVVGRTHAFVTSEERFENDQPSDRIVAFDLRSGHTRGKFEGRWLQRVRPLRMNGDELLVYRRGGVLSPASVVGWDPRTDKETPYLLFVLPEDEESELSDPEVSDILVESGRIFFSRRTVVRDEEHPKEPVLLSMGYGSSTEH